MAVPGAPRNLKGEWSDNVVLLTWEAPEGTPTPTDYVVYESKAGGQLQIRAGESFPDEEARLPLDAGELTQVWNYKVAARSADAAEGAKSNIAPLTIPKAPLEPVEVDRTVFLIGLGAAVTLLLLIKWVTSLLLPPEARFDVTGIQDVAATAFGHRLLLIVAQVAVEMIGWGIALLVVVFVPAALTAALAAVKFRQRAPDRNVLAIGPPGANIDIDKFFAAIREMLKAPAGFGGLLVGLGTILLLIGLFSPAAGAPQSSASPAPSTSVSPGPATEPPSIAPTESQSSEPIESQSTESTAPGDS